MFANQRLSSQRIMIETSLSLMPAVLFKVYTIGWLAVFSLITLTLSCLLTEFVFTKLAHKKTSIKDFSSLVSALLMFIAFNANMPFFVYAIAGIVCVFLGKMIYGGLGKNIFNPAMIAWCFAMISFPQFTTKHLAPSETVDFAQSIKIFLHHINVDAISQATPLTTFKANIIEAIPQDLLILNILILAGGIFLLFRSIINLTPVLFLFLGVIFGIFIFDAQIVNPVKLFILSGPIILTAFYIVTDPATSPNVKLAQAVFSFLVGLIGILISYKGAYPIGIAFATLIMNSFVFILDDIFTRKRKFV
ncbi:MAG: RnfABCDGE type electron transport complex subunit D [Proteobacteria bacterium]|nr:RnfABCDGE type electron transport complex subunit D [Pseudomonadota bacterium]